MTFLKILTAFSIITTGLAQGGSISTSPDSPTTNLLSSSAAGGIDTALFAEEANANHGRGQLFTLPSGEAASFEISSVTIKKSTTQTYDGDVITLRMFAGNQAEWDTGTGHSTPANGDDFYVGTTVTPLHSETFLLNETITDNHYLTFEFATPVTVNGGGDFGFLLTYNRADPANPDRLRHRENGSGGGRISVSTTGHGTSGSRRLVFFVQGTSMADPNVLTLAAPFSDDMVLQRDKPLKIWGNANPDESVTVEIDGKSGSGTADSEGRWIVELPALQAGGPHDLSVTSSNKSLTLDDVLIGDVWLTFGQSNMVRPLGEMIGNQFYLDEIRNNDAPVRCLKVTQFGALTPQEDSQIPSGHYVNKPMEWLPASTAQSWTSVGTVFAHQMYQATGVPTAIIWAAWGSSSIEGWLPADLSEKLPHFAELLPDFYQVGQVGNLHRYATDNGFPTNTAALNSLLASGWVGATSQSDIFVRTRSNVIYNQMIHPLRDFGISGFVWYQGEANADTIEKAATYRVTLPLMIAEYRERFGQGDLPFLGVQLPSFNEATWPWFREAQTALESQPNAYTAITIDTGLANNIHPFDKEPIGIRLSLLARKYQQGEQIEAHGPRFSSMNIAGNQATITFTNADGLTTDNDQPPATFELAGADRIFHPATSATVSGETVVLLSNAEPNPVAVRYAWSPAPVNQVNLVNSVGLPTAPFRTDDWPLPNLGTQTPEAIDDQFETPRDQPLTLPSPGILANDFDLNQDLLAAIEITQPTFGTLILAADGSLTYTPEEGYAGTDSFTYRNSDGSLNSPTATVTINVTGQRPNYHQWRSTIAWNPGDNELSAGDPDQDGYPNFLEFALGLDPLNPTSSGLPMLSLQGENFAYQFNNAQPGVTYKVQLSNDLSTWSDPAFATLTSSDPTPVVIPASETANGKIFVRLSVSE